MTTVVAACETINAPIVRATRLGARTAFSSRVEDLVVFTQDEVLSIRDQYEERIVLLQRENAALEMRLAKALRPTVVKQLDDADMMAIPELLPVVSMFDDPVHDRPTVILDVPSPPVPVTTPKLVPAFMPVIIPTPMFAPVPVPLSVTVSARGSAYAEVAREMLEPDVTEVADDMVVANHRQVTVVAAMVPAPMLSKSMPGAPIATAERAKPSALSTLVVRARQLPMARLRPTTA